MKFKFHRLMSSEPGAGGGGDVIDRGDNLTPEVDTSGEGAAGEAAQAELLAKELEAAKIDAGGDDDADEGVEDKPTKKEGRIPLARHEKILGREREARQALERQLAQYQTGNQVAELNSTITDAENSILALEKDYARLITDGETDKASEKMAEIRRTERGMSEAKADMRIQAAVARATESSRYDTALARIESEYPSLDPDHDDFDEAVLKEVAELFTGYKAQGYTPTDAMQKAVKKELGAKTVAQEKATTVTPRVSAQDVAAARKVAAAAKTVAAVENTPSSTAKLGLDSDKIGGGLSAKAVMGMSQGDFAKIGEKDLARMRGDEI